MCFQLFLRPFFIAQRTFIDLPRRFLGFGGEKYTYLQNSKITPLFAPRCNASANFRLKYVRRYGKPQVYINSVVDTACLPRHDDLQPNIASNGFHDGNARKAVAFCNAVQGLKLKSLAMNLWPDANLEGLILYILCITPSGYTVEELIFFWVPRDGQHIPESRFHGVQFHDVRFRTLRLRNTLISKI